MEKFKYQQIYQQLVMPVYQNNDLTTGCTKNLTGEVAHFGERVANIEGFSRLLWGEAFNDDGRKSQLFKDICRGILAGVDPDSTFYWGKVSDYGQQFVEMVALSVFLIESKVDFWDKLTTYEQENITTYLNQIVEGKVWLNNWQFFKVMVQVAFYKLEVACFSEKHLFDTLKVVHSFYLDEGIYTDGKNNSKDYYMSFCFHFYGLLYDRYMSDFDGKNSGIFRERMQAYLPAYLALFDNDGVAIPYGRSLSYRFAQGALLSMIALSGKIQVDDAILAHLLEGHITYWLKQEIFKTDRTLSIGYAYPNMIMAESYNSSGSPYWAFKFFALLACSSNNKIFGVEKEKLPLGRQHFQVGNFIADRTLDQAFFYPVNNTSGQFAFKDKYNKFVYSTKFGFSISKGIMSIDEGVFDNTLAIKDLDTSLFLTKTKETTFEILSDRLVFCWSPRKAIKIKTTIIPKGNSHLRIHEIETEVPIEIFDIGFANDALDLQLVQISEVTNKIHLKTPYGKTGSENISGYEEVFSQPTIPNTHLLFKRAIISGLKASLSPGSYVFESSHYAYYQQEEQTKRSEPNEY